MTKAEILKKSRNQIEVLKDLLLDEKESRNKLELNYKYLSDAVNSEMRKNDELKADYKHDMDVFYKLKADHEALEVKLKDEKFYSKEMIKKLKAESRHDNKVCEDYDDELIKECHELQAENDMLKEYNEKLQVHVDKYGSLQYDELKRDNDRLNAENKRLYEEHGSLDMG